MKKRIMSLFLILVLCLGLLPVGAFAVEEEELDAAAEEITEEEPAAEEPTEDESVGESEIETDSEGETTDYLDADGVIKGTGNVTELTVGGSYDGGWYILKQSVESRITFMGDAYLIIADGADVTVTGGIGMENDASLTIYAQSADNMGAMTLTDVPEDHAGIGGARQVSCGDITINGGVITTTGGSNGAGIGAGYDSTRCGVITINGGVITATGGNNGAGIGGSEIADCEGIVINGGKVTATGGSYATGIGSGSNGKCAFINLTGGKVTASAGSFSAGIGGTTHTACGDITISGGEITATGCVSGAGIGTGQNGSCSDIVISGGIVHAEGSPNSAGIGSGFVGTCGNITVSGGIIYAVGGEYGSGIGAGDNANCSDITLTGGYIIAQGSNSSAAIGNGYGGSENTYGSITLGGAVIRATKGEIAKQHIGKGMFYDMPINLDENDPPAFDSEEGGEFRTVNCTYTAGVPETCTESGTREYYLDKRSDSGLYYFAIPFTEENEIGDANALEAWLAEGGEGFIPAGHDWETTDVIHTCKRCGESDQHTFGAGSDCTVCGLDLGEKAAHRYYEYRDGVLTLDYAPTAPKKITEGGKKYGAGWYILTESVSKRITFTDDAYLILADGADVTVTGGIGLDDASLTIYAQSYGENMGKLTVTDVEEDNAGIGTGYQEGCGYITVNGGVLNIAGGINGAGIGTGYRGRCTGITINGGVIKARGAMGGAGIGTGYYGQLALECGITLNGGYIDAQGGEDGAGIGTGYQAGCADGITLGDAIIKATKGKNAEEHIGKGSGRAVAVIANDVRYDSGEEGSFRTVNCQFFPAKTGAEEYYLNVLDNNYYSAMPFTEGTLIGGDAELETWLSTTTASTFSEGSGVIIAAAGAVIVAAGALVVIKKKKKA